MRILDWLFQNPFLLILLGGWLLSQLGNMGAKAARRAAEQQQREAAEMEAEQSKRSPAARPVVEAAPPATPPTPKVTPAPRPSRSQPKPMEEAIAELQRMMGIEDEQPKPRPRRVEPKPKREPEVARPLVEPPRSSKPVVRTEPVPYEASVLPVRVELPDPVSRELPVARELAMTSRPGISRTQPVQRRRILDLSDPAKAFVMMEVLGPPRALRGFE